MGETKEKSRDKPKKTRRAKGEGSIYQRKSDGLWVAAVVVGRDEKTGQPVRRVATGRTKGEAKKRLDSLREQFEGAVFIDSDRVTVGEWLKKWLEVYAKPSVRPSTFEWYERLINLYLVPTFGTVKLAKLQGIAIQKMIADLQKVPDTTVTAEDKKEDPTEETDKDKKEDATKETDKDKKEDTTEETTEDKKQTKKKTKKPKHIKGKPLPGPKSARTINAVYNVLEMALKVAVEQGLIRRSPAVGVSLPQVIPPEKVPLLPEQWDALLTQAQDQPDIFTALIVEWATGLRRSELLALMWDDVDFKQSCISISRTIQILRGGVVLAEPKTEATKRVLPVPPEVIQALRVHHAQQAADKLAAEPKEQQAKDIEQDIEEKYDLIFPTSVGTLYDPRNWSKKFARVAKAAGLNIGVHCLRHDLASRIVEAGTPIKEAQYRLGHATVTMLLDRYSHRMTGGQDALAQAMHLAAPPLLKKLNEENSGENLLHVVQKIT